MSIKRKILTGLLIAIVLVALSPIRSYLVSLGVMSVYSNIHEKESIMAQKGFEIDIPGGGATGEKDWYPFVMTFHPGYDFGRKTGNPEQQLTIMYNFPAFDYGRGCSMLYDNMSEYYNGFYGAYVVAEDGTSSGQGSGQSSGGDRQPFGFTEEGAIDTEKTAVVPEYDFFELVLEEFGLRDDDKVFEWTIEDAEEGVSYAGSEGWSRVDARLLVNGAAHIERDGVRSYLQYGAPNYKILEKDEFAPVMMDGRVYGKYFEQWECSVFFYIMASDEGVLEKCDEEILSDSRIS